MPHTVNKTGSGEPGSGETPPHFTMAAPGGPVAFWLTLWLLLLAGVIFLGCVFCHSKEAKGGMSGRQACVAVTKAACRGVLGLILSGLLLCVNSKPPQGSQLGEPCFMRLVEEAAEAPSPPPRGRREEVEAKAPPPPPRGRREEVEAIEANVEAFRSSSIGGKEVIEYRVQARALLTVIKERVLGVAC